MNQLVGSQVEGRQPGRPQPVEAVVNGPQAVLLIDDKTQHGLKMGLLHFCAWIGDGCAAVPFHQLVLIRPGFGMDREKDPAVPAYGNIPDGFVVLEDHLEFVITQQGRRRKVRVIAAASVEKPEDRREQENNGSKQ